MATALDLQKLLRANALFMNGEREINAAIINTFLGVAIWGADQRPYDPISLRELAQRVSLPATTVSRHLRYLGHHERKGVPGMGFVETFHLPDDARAKYVKLTPKGRAMVSELLSVVS